MTNNVNTVSHLGQVDVFFEKSRVYGEFERCICCTKKCRVYGEKPGKKDIIVCPTTTSATCISRLCDYIYIYIYIYIRDIDCKFS